MSDFFRINGLPGLEGLVAEVRGACPKEGPVGIDALINVSVVLGDRNVRFNYPDGALKIDSKYLVNVPDPTREYDTKSPFGMFLFEGHYKKDTLEVAYTMFDNALSVSIFEKHNDGKQKTLYSQNFFKNATEARDLIDQSFQAGDCEDLVFQLKEIKDQETE